MIITTRTARGSAVAATALLALTGGALTACGSEASASPQTHAAADHGKHKADSDAVTALHAAMRTLWAQHMEWTYATVVAFAAESPGLGPTMDRLLQNQTDIGNAEAGFYGKAAGDRLAELLTAHIKDAVPVLTAAKAGDDAGLTTAVEAWYANAQDIGDFLAGANPAWKKGEMRQMMKMHITQTIAYASEVLTGDDKAAIDKYDEAEAHMVEMADMLSEGIVAQFPSRF